AAVRNIFPRRPGTCYTRHNKQKSFQFPPGNQLMALSQRLEFRQSQALVMTPQLMQAIKLLQLSNLDLAAYVDNELERNPLLERTAESEAESERRATDGAVVEKPAEDWPERPVDVADTAPDAHRDAGEQAGDDDSA